MIVLLDKRDSLSWSLMPAVMDRVRQFCEEFGTDGNPELLVDSIRKHFVADIPLMLTVAAVEEGKVVGHAVASIDTFLNKRYLTIMQLCIDKKYRSKVFSKDMGGWKKMLEWGKNNGAHEVQVLTSSKSRSRLFKQCFGLREHRILMRGDL